jgi:hypothetical protein
MEIGIRLFSLSAIGILAGLQLGAWYMGFNGQVTVIVNSGIVGLLAFATGLKINLGKS